jgi:hypothetical protein
VGIEVGGSVHRMRPDTGGKLSVKLGALCGAGFLKDDFAEGKIVDEVLARLGFAEVANVFLGGFKALNSADPDRSAIREITEDVEFEKQAAPKAPGYEQQTSDVQPRVQEQI